MAGPLLKCAVTLTEWDRWQRLDGMPRLIDKEPFAAAAAAERRLALRPPVSSQRTEAAKRSAEALQVASKDKQTSFPYY